MRALKRMLQKQQARDDGAYRNGRSDGDGGDPEEFLEGGQVMSPSSSTGPWGSSSNSTQASIRIS